MLVWILHPFTGQSSSGPFPLLLAGPSGELGCGAKIELKAIELKALRWRAWEAILRYYVVRIWPIIFGVRQKGIERQTLRNRNSNA